MGEKTDGGLGWKEGGVGGWTGLSVLTSCGLFSWLGGGMAGRMEAWIGWSDYWVGVVVSFFGGKVVQFWWLEQQGS